MSKPRLLIIGPDPMRSLGGMATVTRNMLESDVLKREYDLEMYSSFIDGPLYRRVAYSMAREAKFHLRQPSFDICHVHICSATSTWRKLRYIRSPGDGVRRVVLHVHGGKYDVFWNSCSDRQKEVIRGLCASVAKVIVLSEEWRAFFVGNQICDSSKIVVLHNAVELPAEPVDVSACQDVLFLGRLGTCKSPDILLYASKAVLKAHPEVRFRFAGDGDVAKYKTLAMDLGIADSCEFLGWVTGEQKESAIRKSGIYCLPSRHEGMPMSVLEAMSFGMATIATPVGGVPQIIQNGFNGYMVPVGDSRMLSQRICELLDDESLRKAIGRNGRATISMRFGMEKYVKSLLELYASVRNPSMVIGE